MKGKQNSHNKENKENDDNNDEGIKNPKKKKKYKNNTTLKSNGNKRNINQLKRLEKNTYHFNEFL